METSWSSGSSRGRKRPIQDPDNRSTKAPQPTTVATTAEKRGSPPSLPHSPSPAEPPALHPVSPRRGLSTTNGDGGSHTYIIYAAISEPHDSLFSKGLAACAKACDKDVHSACFQRDGTRHVTLFEGRLPDRTAREIRFTTAPFDPPKIEFDGWQPWRAGCYLKLDGRSTWMLRKVLGQVEGLPATGGKRSCDHLSLYRKRGADAIRARVQFERVRAMLTPHQWGSVRVSSVRIKALGSDYDECVVLAGM